MSGGGGETHYLENQGWAQGFPVKRSKRLLPRALPQVKKLCADLPFRPCRRRMVTEKLAVNMNGLRGRRTRVSVSSSHP